MGTAEEPAQPEAERSLSGEQPNHRSRRRRTGPSRDELRHEIDVLRRQRKRLAALSALLGAGCLGLGVGLFLTQSARIEEKIVDQVLRNRLELSMQEAESRVVAKQRELQLAHAQLNALVDQRIPGLQPIQLSRPIEIQQDFVKDITFEQPQGQSALEYKVVVENTSASPIEPSLSVRIFDRVGVQLGHSAPISATGDEPKMLRAGEIRSFFAILDSEFPGTPAYFRIDSEDRARRGRALPQVSAGAP